VTVQKNLSATLLFLALANPLVSQDTKKEFDRSPQNIGSVLVFSGTGWYRHPEVAAISGWLARRSPELEMQVDVSENPNDLLKILPKYKVLVFNNNTELTAILDARHQAAVRDWYRKGGGIVALHAALVRQTEWKWFNGLAGCDFDSDSEYLEARIVVDPKAKDHPAVRGHGMSFRYKADWTNHDRTVTGLKGFQVLLRVDESSYDPVRDFFKTRGGKAMGKDHPVAWLHTNDGGRFFYTELGHDVRSLETPFGRQHITEGIRWAAGLKPLPKKKK
jgi:type 1 glutamine amidotransferase